MYNTHNEAVSLITRKLSNSISSGNSYYLVRVVHRNIPDLVKDPAEYNCLQRHVAIYQYMYSINGKL